MQRDADEIFRVKDLSMLKSPLPSHILRPSPSGSTGKPPTITASSTNSGSPSLSSLLMRPTPKPMGPPPARPKVVTPFSGERTVTKSLLAPLSTTGTPLAKKTIKDVPELVCPTTPEDNNQDHGKEGQTTSTITTSTAEETTEEREHRQLTDMIFADIVDESKLDDDVPSPPPVAALPTTIPTTAVENGTRTLQRRARRHQPISMVDDEVKAELSREANKEEEQEEKDEKEKDESDQGTKENSPSDDNKKVDSEIAVAKAPEPMATNSNNTSNTASTTTTATASDIAAPAMPPKVTFATANTNEYALNNWYLQRIPNNPRFSQVDRSLSEEWIVLVGSKVDTDELWHSSIVVDRAGPKRILTGSGRVYNLKNFDPEASANAGFSRRLAERFAKGFPETWRDLLIEELNTSGKTTTAANDKTNGKTASAKTNKTTATPQSSSAKRSSPACRAGKARTPSTKKARTTSTPMTMTTTTPVVAETRSGRKVVTPIPFWDSKAALAALSKPSPTARQTKRRWGNAIDLL